MILYGCTNICTSGIYTDDNQCCTYTCDFECPNGYKQGTCKCECIESYDPGLDEIFDSGDGIAPPTLPV